MLNTGPAKKVTVYVQEGQTHHGMACYAAVLDYLFFRGISDATVTRGMAGFGTGHKMHTASLVDVQTIYQSRLSSLKRLNASRKFCPSLLRSQARASLRSTTRM